MNDETRQNLLGRVERPSQTIGEAIPDEICVQGNTLELRELVFECKRLETVSTERREQIEDLKRTLQRERLERKQRIEREDISEADGQQLVRSIHGIDRALNALESLDRPDIGEQLRQKQIEDANKLISLIEQATA